MVKEKIEKAINMQINVEMYSSYLYLSMATYFRVNNFNGFSKWMEVQSKEEWGHAMKFYDYMIDRRNKPVLLAIEAPKEEWKSPLDAFVEAYKHEQKVTDMINDLVDLAIKENDHATNNMLQWFVTEQVEEESNTSTISQRLKMIGDSTGGLMYLDHELGKRGEK